MGYPHHHVQAPMGSSLDPKFPPSEDYTNYTNINMTHTNVDYIHHQQPNGFSHHQNGNYNYGQHFYHHHNYGSPQIPHHSANIQNNSYNGNSYYGGYYASNSSNTPIMDLPIQCATATEPQNTALGLQELGTLHLSASVLRPSVQFLLIFFWFLFEIERNLIREPKKSEYLLKVF